MTTKVSIVMCVYNGEKHLSKAIESILSQTFSDFEFITVDDGSTDSTPEILAKFSVEDSRITVIRNDRNLGLERSLNVGLSAAKSQYFARQDADDISFPDRLARQVEFLDSYPTIGAICTAVKYIDEQGNETGQDCLPEDHASLQALLLFNNFMHHSTLMTRRDLIQALGGYDETKQYAEDYDLWWRLSKLSKLSSLSVPLLYRRLDDSPRISKRYRKQQLHCSFEIALKAVKESLGDNSKELNIDSYRRWWWAYLQTIDAESVQKFWTDSAGSQTKMTISDIKNLRPFWNLLASSPARSEVWGARIRMLSYRFFRKGQILQGMMLLDIATRQLNSPILWKHFVKKVVFTIVPIFKSESLRIQRGR